MISMTPISVHEQRPRPPTPPKDPSTCIDEALEFLQVDYSLGNPPTTVLQGIETPPHPSPLSSQNESGRRTIKKVEFCPYAVKHEGADVQRAALLLRPLPSLNEQRPLRSILKSPSEQLLTPDESSPAPIEYFSPGKPQDFPKMLDSVMKLLAAPSTMMRLDGYRTLNGALKAYDNLPDREALRSKTRQISHCIMRDLTPITDDPMNTTLITQALKLSTNLTALRMTSTIGDDFEGRLVDKAIEVLGQDQIVKAVANHYLYLLAYEKFGPKVMTTSRAEQLVQRLDTIDKKITGSTVIATRLAIYLRLLEKAPTVMLSKLREWLNHVFHGVLSTTKDTRQRAIVLGIQAGLALGTHYSATKAMVDLFNSEVKDGGTYGAYLIARLYDMIARKDSSEVVPQIWSLVILFFRNRKRPLHQWQMFRPWLVVIQRCLNSSDKDTKDEAMIAWNRLVFVVDPDEHVLNPMQQIVPMLKVPLMSNLDKKETDTLSRHCRRVAMSGYCNLLYYALRPTQSHEHLDVYWDEYVTPVLSKMLKAHGKDAKFACRVIEALCKGSGAHWNLNRANEATQTTPEDLPRVDPAWVRSRLHKILELLEPYFRTSFWLPGKTYDIESTPWKQLMMSVADAGRQEVRASMESREAMAHLMNFFSRLWTGASSAFTEQTYGTWVSRLGVMILTAVECLGPQQFVDENLTRNQADLLEPAPTPSHRPSKHHSVLQSPVVCLFGLFQQPPVTVDAGDAYFDVLRNILQALYPVRASRKTRLALIRQCLPATDMISKTEKHAAVTASLWELVALETARILADRSLDESVQDAQNLGSQCRHTIALLTNGLAFHAVKPSITASGLHLYSVACKRVREDAGDATLAPGLVEPFADALLKQSSSTDTLTLLQYTTALLQSSIWPRSRQSLDDARKRLWGQQLNGHKQGPSEPFVHLYTLLNTVCVAAYRHEQCRGEMGMLVAALQSFISSCPHAQAATTLRQIQAAVAVLVEDKDRLFTGHSTTAKQTALKLSALWKDALSSIQSGPIGSTLLKAMSDIMAAGFSSTNRSIVNSTVVMWNEKFGELESLEYPANVEAVLRQLRQAVDIELPTFPNESKDTDSSFRLPYLIEEHESSSEEELTPRAKMPFSGQARLTPNPLTSAHRKRIQLDAQKEASTHKSGDSSTPKARLRHNDSQIQFVPVESSPLVAQDESQNLTEHQKETMEKQQTEAAQMYSDFSSSALRWTTESGGTSHNHRGSSNRLDFTLQRQNGHGEFGTPEPIHEENGPMDDFLSSSPTRRTAEKPRPESRAMPQHVEAVRKDLTNVTDMEVDIPSSPPEIEDDVNESEHASMSVDEEDSVSHEDLADVMDTAEENVHQDHKPLGVNATSTNQGAQPLDQTNNQGTGPIAADAVAPTAGDVDELGVTEDTPKLLDVDASEKTRYPQAMDIQVISEPAEDADYAEGTTEVPSGFGEPEEDHASGDSSPIHFEESVDILAIDKNDEDPSIQIKHEVTDQDPVPTEAEVTRIEDSFVNIDTEDMQGSQNRTLRATPARSIRSAANSQQSAGSSRKRKRTSSMTPVSSKRNKHNSPIKQFFSRLVGSQSEEEDEDIQDCIVVNSQPKRVEDVASSQPRDGVRSSSSAIMEPPKVKRGRGRPRKSGSPASSEASQARPLKRRASALSDGVSSEPERDLVDDTTVIDTPALSKTRRQSKSQDAKTVGGIQAEMIHTVNPQAGRKLDAVVIPATDFDRSEYKVHDSDVESEVSPEKQLRQEQAAASQNDRVIAKPKSIFARLKDLIRDVTGVSFNSQEEKEFHNGVWELDWASREAGRRGRAEGLP